MKDNGLWRMFCETGNPVCYLMYRSTAIEKESSPVQLPADTLAFSGEGVIPSVRF